MRHSNLQDVAFHKAYEGRMNQTLTTLCIRHALKHFLLLEDTYSEAKHTHLHRAGLQKKRERFPTADLRHQDGLKQLFSAQFFLILTLSLKKDTTNTPDDTEMKQISFSKSLKQRFSLCQWATRHQLGSSSWCCFHCIFSWLDAWFK